MESFRNRLLSLNFAPFVLVNGMNLFPMFIFSQLFLAHERDVRYLMPLILYYSFKTNILFLTRLKPIQMNRLLVLSISLGVLGCLAGTLIGFNVFYGWLAGALLGACSGTLFPSYMTIQYHERDLNHFGTTIKEQLFSLGFALIFSLILFKLVTYSIGGTLFFLGINLILLYLILSSYPAYQLEYEGKTPHYSIIETLFFFVVGFFIIFILKSEKSMGMATVFPLLLVFFLILMLSFIIYLRKARLKRRFKPMATLLMIYKGMLTNFIFVFCTLYQLLRHGSSALYLVYSLYLTAIIIAPPIFSLLNRTKDRKKIIFYGFLVSFLLLVTNTVFYVGVFTLSLVTSMYNQSLNQAVYHYKRLPRDLRLVAKYRLGNIGSILHQLLMMAILALVSSRFDGITVSRIMNDYAYKIQDNDVLFMMFLVKICLIVLFFCLLLMIRKQEKRENIFN